MGDREIKFRIAADGSSGRQEYASFAAAGKKAYEDLRAAAATTTQAEQATAAAAGEIGNAIKSAAQSYAVFDAASKASTERQLQSYLRLADVAKQAASADQAQSRFSSFMGIGGDTKSARDSAAVFQEQIRLSEEMESRVARLRSAIDPLGVAQQKLNAEETEANQLYAAGRISIEELGKAHILAQQRFEATRRSLGAMGDGGRLAGYQLTNLQFQLNDIVTGLASGQNPFTVMIQQGLQISQLMGPGSGGVSGLFKGFTELLGRLATPARLGMGTVAALAGTAVLAFSESTQEGAALGDVLQGVGRRAGATATDIDRIARSGADAGRISVAAARDIEVALLRTGKVGVGAFEEIAANARKYAAVTGESFDDANKELTQTFADPAKGIETLTAKLGGFDDATKQNILNLAAQGDQMAASQALADALAKRLANVSEDTTMAGRSWTFMSRMASDLWTAIKDHVNPSLADNIEIVKKNIEFNDKHGMATDRLRATLAVLEDQYHRTAAAARESGAADDAAARQTTGLAIARNVVPEPGQILALRQQLANVDAALQSGLSFTPDKSGKSPFEIAWEGHERLAAAINSYLTPAQKAADLNRQEISALTARSIAEKGAAAEERARLDLAGQNLSASEVDARVRQAGALARAQAATAIDDETRALTSNARAAFASADAFLRSEAAGEEAEARRKALSEAIRNGVDVETRARQILLQQAGEEAAAGARSIATMSVQTDAQKALNDQIEIGGLTIATASNRMKEWIAVRGLSIALSEAETSHDAAKAQQIRGLIAAMRGVVANDNAEAARGSALRTESGQLDELAAMRLEASLINQNTGSRAIELAQLRERLSLISQGVDPESELGQKIIANTGYLEEMRQRLALIGAVQSELSGFWDQELGSLQNFATQGEYSWKSLGDLGLSVLRDWDAEIIKLSLLNPFKNWAFGLTGSDKLPEFGDIKNFGGKIGGWLSSAGDFLADLFHGGGTSGMAGSSRLVDPRIFLNAPKMHRGYDPATEQPAILLRGQERVLNPRETREYPDLVSAAHANASNGSGMGMVFNHKPQLIIQGGAGPAEIEAAMAGLEEMNEDFERRAIRAVGEGRRRKVRGLVA